MPKSYENLVTKLKGKEGVDNPYALAHSIRQKQGKEKRKPVSLAAKRAALKKVMAER